MKYVFIYVISFFIISLIWIRAFVIENRLDRVEELKVESNAMPSPDYLIEESENLKSRTYRDTIYVPYDSSPPQEEEFSFLDFSNEIMTLLIGMGNLVTVIVQLKDRKKNSKNQQNN